ncbi:MAG: hypothetical protein ACKOC1_06615 [Hyphomicrobiales bacterium]
MRFTIQRLDFDKASAETEKNAERAVTSGIRDADDTSTSDLREDAIAVGIDIGPQFWRSSAPIRYPK